MWGERIRGIIAVGVVCAAIGIAFVTIDAGGDEDTTTASTSTTVAPTTSTTTTVPDETADFDRLCELTTELYTTLVEGSVFDIGHETRALETFYTGAATLNLDFLTPEYQAAARHYQQYNAVGGPFGYDTERILSESDDADRWVSLVTRPAVGVDESRAHVLFICGVDLPEAPSVDEEDIEEILEDIADEEDDG